MRDGYGLTATRLRIAVAAWAGLWFAGMSWRGGTSWHWFVQGQQALLDLDDQVAGGLHLYAAHPFLQIGPVAFVVASLASLAAPVGPGGALLVAQLLGALSGLLVLALLATVARDLRPGTGTASRDRRTATVAVFFVPVWTFLAVAVTHLDDVLALVLGVLALRAAVSNRPMLTGLLVGLAVDAKPWAVPFACLLLLLPHFRDRVVGAAVAASAVAVAWLPFVLADPETLRALHYTIPNTALSALRVLGIDDPRTPGWVRPAQTVLGLGLGALAVRRRRAAAVILVVVAARLVLDPGTNRYYTAGLAVGAAVWDLVGARTAVPWWSAAVCLGLFGSRSLGLPPTAYGILTLCFFLAAGALAAGAPAPARVLAMAAPRAVSGPARSGPRA